MPFRIEYVPLAIDHLRGLSARDQRSILDAVDEQLQYQADVPTRHRKPLRPNNLATWELRVGEIRVFYDILPSEQSDEDEIADQTVSVLAVGVKRGNRLFVGSEEIQL